MVQKIFADSKEAFYYTFGEWNQENYSFDFKDLLLFEGSFLVLQGHSFPSENLEKNIVKLINSLADQIGVSERVGDFLL